MKPTFRPVVYAHHKRKDGTFNVKINVYFNGKERRLPTTIYCTKNDLTRSHHIKNQDIINKCNVLIEKMYNAISDVSTFDIQGKDVDWVVNHIRAKLTASNFNLDFFDYADTFLSTMNQNSRKSYETALNAFAFFLGRRTIDVNDITKTLLSSFIDHCDSLPKMSYDRRTGELKKTRCSKRSGLASANHINRLSTIFNSAKIKYNDEDNDMILIPRSPFTNLNISMPAAEGQKPIPASVIQMMIDDDTPAGKNGHRYAIDVMLVSFCLMGVNIADLFFAKPPKDNVWIYNRCKTRERRADNAEMHVEIPEQLHPYLARLGAGKSREYWLPVMRETSQDRKTVILRVNRCIRSWCKKNGIDEFTTYALRKSWATLARSTGADKSLVDECIGHTGDFRMTDIYALRPWDRMAELNRKVLDMFEWKRED